MIERSLFIGDSHTCGFDSVPGQSGPGSFTYWNENNYSEIYSDITETPVVTYAQAGVNNRTYTDWLRFVLNTYHDIKDVFICLAPLNRFTLAFADNIIDDAVSVDFFTVEAEGSNENKKRYCDNVGKDDTFQLYQKPTAEDYGKFPGFELDLNGLKKPDLRKNTYMQIKLFNELNTFIEKRDFLLNIYAWDRMAAETGAHIHLFKFMDRGIYPVYDSYYGDLKNTFISSKSVEQFFKDKFIDPARFLLADNEHYNKEYHTMIAKQFIPWLKNEYSNMR